MDGIWHYSWDSFLELQISDFHMEMCSPPTNRGQIKGNSINWSVLSVQYVKSEIFDRQPTSLRYVTYKSVNAKKQKGLNDRNDVEAQVNTMDSEIAHLIDRMAIAKRRKKKREVVLPFVPCLRQAGYPAILENVDFWAIKDWDRKSTRLNSSHMSESRMPSSAWKKKTKIDIIFEKKTTKRS